jgi:hypothetical protein
MAQDYRSLDSFPAIKTFTANNSTCVEIQLPSDCNQITLASDGHKFFVGQQGQTDGDAITADNFFVLKDEKFVMRIGKGRNRSSSIFVQSSHATDDISVMLEEV